MQATARNRYAAVLLLAPLAAALVAAHPANAQVFVHGQAMALPPAPAPVVVEPQPAWGYSNGYGYNYRPHWDHRGPRIYDVTPSERDGTVFERWGTRVSARLADEDSGVDFSSVRMRLDGRDVTYRTRIEANEVHVREELPSGRHYAEVAVRDRAGNWSTRTWSFDVVERGWGRRYGWNSY